MSTHTPGPWRVIERTVEKNGTPRVHSNDGGIAVMCINRYMGEDGPSAKELANARLIAAAPELLAALERGLTLMQATGNGKPMNDPRQIEIVEQARAAIAKAVALE